ncbi:DUF4245 family protein [Corynebacterium sp. 4HC-13]|uniref:DUF4245 family protein n=2 Tax=Corynebacterium anserum TaxID=2684406 RepID=A0A7G7YPC7_9CORY|nr:DUF4245 domain-containing protein [Corynebacterium anserum]MBC2681959.1 DUF4245 family protein [Corynebacterium anserum]QNH96347.1 DUF4245 family protein [Corynebacterium anserum]
MAGVRIEKPRVFQSAKDMVLSLGVLLLAMFLVVGFTGLCSVKPGGPDQSGPVHEVDVDNILHMDAQALNFPIRIVTMPDGWVPNSQRRTQVAKQTSVLTGWVIDGDKYISLTQTPADLKDAMHPDDDYRDEVRIENIGGKQWHVLEGDDVRPLWVADNGDVRFILKGMATDDLMRTAAEHTVEAQPVEKAHS